MKKQEDKQPQGFIASLIGEPTPSKRAGVTYSLAVLAFLGVSFLVALLPRGEETPQWYLYCGYLAAPVAFAIVIAWYFSHTKTTLKGFLKEGVCSPKYYLIALFVQLGLLSLGELNGLFLQFLAKFGYQASTPQIPSTEGGNVVWTLLVVALLPALFEEFFFRGVFQKEMRGFSLWGQVLVCGGFFSLFHQNPAQTVYQFICGGAFALVAARSGSFFPTVLSHFINNALIVILYACGVTQYSLPLPVLIIGGVCLVGSIGYLALFDKGGNGEKTGSYKQLFACASLGVLVVGLSWLTMLFSGF